MNDKLIFKDRTFKQFQKISLNAAYDQSHNYAYYYPNFLEQNKVQKPLITTFIKNKLTNNSIGRKKTTTKSHWIAQRWSFTKPLQRWAALPAFFYCPPRWAHFITFLEITRTKLKNFSKECLGLKLKKSSKLLALNQFI